MAAVPAHRRPGRGPGDHGLGVGDGAEPPGVPGRPGTVQCRADLALPHHPGRAQPAPPRPGAGLRLRRTVPPMGRQLDRHRFFHSGDVAGCPRDVPLTPALARIRAAVRGAVGLSARPLRGTRKNLQGLRRGRLRHLPHRGIQPPRQAARRGLVAAGVQGTVPALHRKIHAVGRTPRRRNGQPGGGLQGQDRADGRLAGVPVERPGPSCRAPAGSLAADRGQGSPGPPLRRARGRCHCLRRGSRGPGSSRAGGHGAGVSR